MHTVNVIPGRLYMSRFDIYDANSGSLLGGYLMPSAMYPMTTREPAITLEESGGNLVISNYQSYGYARASIQATGTFFMIGGAVETPWRSYSNLTYLSNIPTANSSTIDTIVVAGGEALTVSNVQIILFCSMHQARSHLLALSMPEVLYHKQVQSQLRTFPV